MAENSSLMAASLLTSGFNQLSSGYSESRAAAAAAGSSKSAADLNTMLAGVSAEDAIARGEADVRRIKKSARRMIGSQRAAYAAQGLDPDAGSALDAQSDTAALSEVDVLTARNNAWREAWGFRVEAVESRRRGDFAALSGSARSRASILSGSLGFLSEGMKAEYYRRQP